MIAMIDLVVCLIYGIPNFKLEKEIVNKRIKRLKDSGINFVLNCEIGSTNNISMRFKK